MHTYTFKPDDVEFQAFCAEYVGCSVHWTDPHSGIEHGSYVIFSVNETEMLLVPV